MKEQLQKDFDNIIKNLSLSQRDTEIKQFYLDNFINKGFPNRRDENWKFSDLNQIIKKNIGELSFYNDYTSTNKVDTSVFVDGLEHNKIVFINGRIEKIDFDYEKKDKIEIIDEPEIDDRSNNFNSLIDLNKAFTNKSYKILVKKDYQLVKPLIIYHLTNNKIKSKNINLSLDFQLEENSSLRIIDLFNDNSEKNFLNIFYNFDLKQNAILKNYKIDKSKIVLIHRGVDHREFTIEKINSEILLKYKTKYMQSPYKKVIVYDLETGGLDYKVNSITEIAMVVIDLETLKVEDTFTTMIKPNFDLEFRHGDSLKEARAIFKLVSSKDEETKIPHLRYKGKTLTIKDLDSLSNDISLFDEKLNIVGTTFDYNQILKMEASDKFGDIAKMYFDKTYIFYVRLVKIVFVFNVNKK